MADSKLTELTATSSINATDLLYVVNGGNSRRITASNLIVSLTQIKSAPANTKGVYGDKAGMIAFDSNYFYVCTTDYTSGTANIWKRASISAW